MIINVNHRSYSVRWKHWREGELTTERVTSCLIEPLDLRKANEHVIGVAVCSKKDNFCKETGRKVSLARAIQELPRPLRAQVWKQYFERGEK